MYVLSKNRGFSPTLFPLLILQLNYSNVARNPRFLCTFCTRLLVLVLHDIVDLIQNKFPCDYFDVFHRKSPYRARIKHDKNGDVRGHFSTCMVNPMVPLNNQPNINAADMAVCLDMAWVMMTVMNRTMTAAWSSVLMQIILWNIKIKF